MIKVLLVDDEVLVRHDLHTLIDWELHGFTICGEAVNGMEALQLAESTEPHIAILDINMPGMDGVDLCKALQERHPEIKKIVLSSYDKFDYVRDTLKNGAIDYLLKHELDGRTLLGLLKKARNELAEAAKQSKLWKKISPAVTQDAVRELLLGRTDSLEQLRAMPQQPFFLHGRNMAVAVLQIDNFILLTGTCSEPEKIKFVQSALDLCQRMLQDARSGIACHMEQGRFAIVYFFEQYSHHQIGQHVAESLQRIRKSLEMYLDAHVLYEYSGIIQGLQHVREAYLSTCKQLRQQHALDSGGGGLPLAAGMSGFTLSLDHERKLMTAVKLKDERASHAVIDEVFAPYLAQRTHDDAIPLLVNEFIHIANKVWVKSGTGKEKYYEGDHLNRDRIKSTDRQEDTIDWLKRLYSQLISKLMLLEEGGIASSYVEMAVRHIKQHYSASLSLDSVAEHVGITTSYLSRLFREEMQCGFTEFLNRERIKAARQFIESGDYKLKDIYEKVGFGSYNYFFKVFKDVTGVTPQSYGKNVHGQG